MKRTHMAFFPHWHGFWMFLVYYLDMTCHPQKTRVVDYVWGPAPLHLLARKMQGMPGFLSRAAGSHGSSTTSPALHILHFPELHVLHSSSPMPTVEFAQTLPGPWLFAEISNSKKRWLKLCPASYKVGACVSVLMANRMSCEFLSYLLVWEH